RRARSSLIAIPGIGDVSAELLYQNGFKSAEELAAADEETVAEIEGIGPERAGTILAAARAHVEQQRAEAAALAAAGEAERAGTDQASADAEPAPEEGRA
ncbi:MAG: helix-hairpin-helix domain-containing protein, partial [Deltaproteobacteria bacterium]